MRKEFIACTPRRPMRSQRVPSCSKDSRSTITSFWYSQPKTPPELLGEQSQRNDQQLAGDESHQPLEARFHKAVGVEADAEHVHAEPGETGDDVAEDGHAHQAALLEDATPACVQK